MNDDWDYDEPDGNWEDGYEYENEDVDTEIQGGIKVKPDYTAAMETLCRAAALPRPVSEYRFDQHRRWRFDFCWPAAHLALEIEGGVYSNGRHVRGNGFIGDMEKYNNAVMQGWKIMRYTPEQFCNGAWIENVRYVLEGAE